jgi:hypothetical protein
MRNVLHSCRVNQNTFYVQRVFSENRAVYEIMSKNAMEPDRLQVTSQYGAYALRPGLASLHARMRMYTLTRPGTRMYARTHARVHPHRSVSSTYCFLSATMTRERA